ncbi:MAG: HDOD domain-containing protein [Gammaproteobacteria bacterium]|nr:HDOD domain-containing protein [Gammaproteobacteria bacterium]
MTPQDMVRGARGSFSLPENVLQINELVERTASAKQIADAMALDLELSAKVLKLANSPLYGMSGRIDSISRAVTLVGTKGLRDMVLSAAIVSKFSTLKLAGIDGRAFWRRSLACAAMNRELAVECNLLYTEPMFVAGLMSHLGELVIAEKLPEISAELRQRADNMKTPLHDIETRELGFSHADVGRELMLSWRLPPFLQEIVSCHHQPAAAVNFPLGAALLNIADLVADPIGGGEVDPPAVTAQLEAVMLVAGLSEQQLHNAYYKSCLYLDQMLDILQVQQAA